MLVVDLGFLIYLQRFFDSWEFGDVVVTDYT